jgi:hypothetical protein
MNCFHHPTTAAVGICKSCGKGLCPSCAADLGKGLACKGRCEEDVTNLIGLIDRNIQRSPMNEELLKKVRTHSYRGEIFNIVFGLILIGFSVNGYFQYGLAGSAPLLAAMGLCFLVFGLTGLCRAPRFPRTPK